LAFSTADGEAYRFAGLPCRVEKAHRPVPHVALLPSDENEKSRSKDELARDEWHSIDERISEEQAIKLVAKLVQRKLESSEP
jgi:hypothetical protein